MDSETTGMYKCTVQPRLSRMGCQLKKGVGLSTAHMQSHMANEKGVCLLTAHVQSHILLTAQSSLLSK